MAGVLGPFTSTGAQDFYLDALYEISAVLTKVVTRPLGLRVETDAPTDRIYGMGWFSLGSNFSGLGFDMQFLAPEWIILDYQLFVYPVFNSAFEDYLRTSIRAGGEVDFLLVYR